LIALLHVYKTHSEKSTTDFIKILLSLANVTPPKNSIKTYKKSFNKAEKALSTLLDENS